MLLTGNWRVAPNFLNLNTHFPETELILNPDGSVYHLGLLPENIANTIIAVGDPARVATVSRYFQKIVFKKQKREFITHTGIFSGKPVTVISTGMGTDNVEIFMHELDALVNIDLGSRKPRARHRSLNIIRVGTSGSLQADVDTDTLLASQAALGLDTLMSFYQRGKHDFAALETALQQHLGLPFQPYFAACSPELLQRFGDGMAHGVTVTTPGFYAPQGRQLRYRVRFPRLLGQLGRFSLPSGRFTNFEMETAAYYALGQMLGHKTLSLNAILANRTTGQFSADPAAPVDKLVRHVLNLL